MSNETIQSKIELLEEQIENVQHSGYFTDSEIERSLPVLKQELELLQNNLLSKSNGNDLINQIEVVEPIIQSEI